MQQLTKHLTHYNLTPAIRLDLSQYVAPQTLTVCLLEYIINGSGFTANHSLPVGPYRPTPLPRTNRQ
jgi:hypothetical protein